MPFFVIVAVVLGCGRATTNQGFLKHFFVLLSDDEVVAETAPEELAALLAPDLAKVLIMLADQLLLHIHEL